MRSEVDPTSAAMPARALIALAVLETKRNEAVQAVLAQWSTVDSAWRHQLLFAIPAWEA